MTRRCCWRISKVIRSGAKGVKKQVNAPQTETASSVVAEETNQFERPRVCEFDLPSDSICKLKQSGFSVAECTLGDIVQIAQPLPNNRYICKWNATFPVNPHEKDIAIIDLQEPKYIPYDSNFQLDNTGKHRESLNFIIEFPQSVFDPRGYSAINLQSVLEQMPAASLIIVFAAKPEVLDYCMLRVRAGTRNIDECARYHTYNFYKNSPPCYQHIGKETTVNCPFTEMGALLNEFNNQFSYEVAFEHPQVYRNNTHQNDPEFFPLITTQNGEIVSFLRFSDNKFALVFPFVERKADFILRLFLNVLPELFPKLFPDSSAFAWLKESAYMLPNERVLLEKKLRYKNNMKMRCRKLKQRLREIIIDTNFCIIFLHKLVMTL